MIAALLRSATLLAVACCSAVTAAALPPDATVIRFHPSYGICSGVCPYFETEVSADGSVRTLDLRSGEFQHFEAKPRDMQRFTELMDKLRPEQDRKLDQTCARGTLEGGSPDPLSNPRADDIEVRWYAASRVTRLTACEANGPIRTALQDALRALGADPFSGAALADVTRNDASDDEEPHGNLVEIVNDTPFTILHLYAHEEGMADWTEDWLGDQLIEPGKSLKMDFNAGPNRCRYDIRIEFIDGDDFNLARFDACAETVLHVSVG